MKNSRFTLYRIVIIGLMAAMVFVCTMFLGIRIPTPTGTTQLKTANAICLLTGLLFGGWTGGLAAGIGSALFDLTYPEWAAGAWLTFIFFFAMGAICGGIAHAGGAAGKNKARNWVAAICGAVGTGGINAVFAIVVSNLLAALLRPKLESAGIYEALKKH